MIPPSVATGRGEKNFPFSAILLIDSATRRYNPALTQVERARLRRESCDVIVVGGNRILNVMVAPDVGTFAPNTSLAVELDLEFSSGVISAVLNDSFWNVQGVNPGNNPFTGSQSEGLVVDTANNTVFIAVGSELFATPTPMLLMTVEVLWQQYTSFNMGGRTVLSGTPEEYLSGRIAQNGVNYNGVSLSPAPRACSFEGDFDCSGATENGDLTLLLDNWGEVVPPVPVGWTGVPLTPPAVANDELTALLDGWRNIAGSGSVGKPVPEPTASILFALGIVLAVFPGRRCSPASRSATYFWRAMLR